MTPEKNTNTYTSASVAFLILIQKREQADAIGATRQVL